MVLPYEARKANGAVAASEVSVGESGQRLGTILYIRDSDNDADSDEDPDDDLDI